MASPVKTTEAQGKHFYQFYRDREDLFRVVIPFLTAGLENNEACLWIVSRSIGVLEAVEAFQHASGRLNPFLKSGQLSILPAERWYLDRGHFSEARVLHRAQKYIDDKKRRGFKAFRGVGDLSWLRDEWKEFQSYEKKIHTWIQTLPLSAICAYPIEHCSMAQAKDIVDHHDHIFVSRNKF